MAKELTVLNSDSIKKLSDSVTLAIQETKGLEGFEKAFKMAASIELIRELLTDDYMRPIMSLQGSKLGFKTDKDLNRDKSKGPGYPVAVVKDCLIEAVLTGLQPCGNQFNIIAGNMYITKEGITYLLDTYGNSLSYKIVPGFPIIGKTNPPTSAAIDMHITWTVEGVQHKQTLPVALKIDQWTGLDSMVGKGTRKAAAWLYRSVSGVTLPDGDVDEMKVMPAQATPAVPVDKEAERVALLIHDAKDITQLESLQPHLKTDELQDQWNTRMVELQNKK